MTIVKGLAGWFGWGRFAALLLLVGLVAIRILDPTPTQTLRNQAFDVYQRIKPRVYVPQPVAIIDIDEASIREHGQWPWPRSKLADLVTNATRMGAVAIGFDIVFAERDRLSPALIAEDNDALSEELKAALLALPSNDTLFANAIKNSRIVVGQTSVRRLRDATEEAQPIRDIPHAFLGADPTPFLRQYPSLVQNLPELEDVAMGHGMFTIEPDADGIIRRIPLVMMVKNKIRLFLSVELLRIATGGGAFAVKTNDAGLSGVVVGKQLIQTDGSGAVWPYFSPTVPQRYVSAGDVLTGKVDPSKIQGRLLLVGTSAIGLEDYRATPMGSLMAGVEIHAQLIENILTKQMLVRPNYALGVELVVVVALGVLAIILVPMLNALWSFIVGGVLVAGYVGGSYYYFDTARLLIDPVYPVISTTLLFMVLSTADYFSEERKRREIKGAFGQYVSPDLVNKLTDNPEGLSLGGETRELSVLFSDVRGFTGISESYKDNPHGLTVLMNKFLTALSRPILKEQGTIDKFMGDAVMAFWNAPLDHNDHAHAACIAAVGMMTEVSELNQKTKLEHEVLLQESPENAGEFHAINVGIGINTGQCVVGNMGSDNRFDYTALGDTVNLASRLEGQSKPYGIGIVLGSLTAKQVQDRLAILEIDLIRVKGKNEPERIFGLFGDEEIRELADFKAARALNQSMIASYRSQDWESAFDAVEMLREVTGRLDLGLDDYLFIYETRIAEFRANPPGREWDGVYTATSK